MKNLQYKDTIYKSFKEYGGDNIIQGLPYLKIVEDNDIYYLLKLNNNQKYEIYKSSKDFVKLHEEALKIEKTLKDL